MPVFNEAGLQLIKSFESCSLMPYLDVKGIPTIGYGHTAGVTMQEPIITQSEADVLLAEDLTDAEMAVQNAVNVDLNDNQYSALVSLVFNCGSAPLSGHLGAYLNAGNYQQAADAFLAWDHAKIDGVEQVVPGLANRRAAERELFLT